MQNGKIRPLLLLFVFTFLLGARAIAEVPALKKVSLTPNLAQTDAYEFLDPVSAGHKAPNFTTRTVDGKPLRLVDFKGKNLVMVFYQGSFCSVCGAQLSNLQSHLADFKAQNAAIVAVSADDVAHAKETIGMHGLGFPVIPDTQKKLIHAFGVGNISKQGLAWPAVFVIDKQGIVRLGYASADGHRMHSNEILPVLSKLTGKPSPSLSYDQ